jgi:acetyl coenzyme A synthetase (ADP forming)-like protein
VALRDGSTVHVRPIRPEDRSALETFLGGLSIDSRMLRFFSAGTDLGKAAGAATDVDYSDRHGLIATRGEDAHLVAHAGYVRSGADRAEVAFAISAEMQGRGLGTILLAHLAEAADEQGIATLEAEVMPENRRMLEVFRESGLPLVTRSEPGAVHVELPSSFTAEALERFEQRDAVAATAAMRKFFEPRSIAVIGASRERGTVGGEIFHNLIEGGFEGVVHPVNTDAEVVQSVRAQRSVEEIEGPVDLAVVAVPADAVASVVRECASKGVPALVVISAGFGEVGDEGERRESELLEICRGAGMRLIGPNCLGILNAASGVRLNATFAPGSPPPGNVGFLSQSGALGLAMIELASERRLGLSTFASIGNRADITGNDVLEYWESAADTDVALLYIESFSDPRRFSRVARRIGRRKPIVVVKSGRSQAGARATISHTGALLAGSDATVAALFEQAGVIRTDTLGEMLDVVSLLASQPLPAGRRVAIVTNAGGPGVMCADACEAAGLEVPELPEELREQLRKLLPAEAALGNPVDMVATATADQYRGVIGLLAAWGGIDAMIVIFIRPLLTRAEDVAAAVGEVADRLPRPIPIQTVFLSERDRRLADVGGRVPTVVYPEDAARALARVVRHTEWRARPSERPPAFADVDADSAALAIAGALGDGESWLGIESLQALLEAHRIPLVRLELVAGPAEAGLAADALGGRVALKAVGPEIVHKTDLGAVALGLEGAAEVTRAATRMDEQLQARGVRHEAFAVQPMVEGGTEMLLGVVGDEVFGPVIACGAGGVQAEVLKDVAIRICPIGRADAREMIRSLSSYPLLTGYRGAPSADVESLEELLLRLSAMVEAHHELAEVDFNPVLVGAEGARVLDARVRVEAAPPRSTWPRTWH